MQPLYYYLDSSTNKLETSPHPIMSQVQKTSQGKFTQRFFNSNGELIETLKCILKNGIPQGSATKKFPNGDTVTFQFNNQGMMEGEAKRKVAGGRIISFKFFRGLALGEGEEDEKYAGSTLTPRVTRSERMHRHPSDSLSPANGMAPSSRASIVMNDEAKILLDPHLLLQTICPKNSIHESAIRFCHNDKDVPVDLRTFVLRLKELLDSVGITLSEFNLTGGTLQSILLQKQKKQGGDIDFLGFAKTKNGKDLNPHNVLAVFSQVLEEQLFQKNVTKPQEAIAKFTRKPYILKTFICNQDFMIATIPFQLQDPNNPLIMTSMDVDIRINFRQQTSCIGSATCFKCNLITLFENDSSPILPVLGAEGYEKSVAKAFQLLQKGQFFVHEPSAATTINGLRAYTVLLVKGLFPCDFRSSWIYFTKWQAECEAKESTELGVNDFFQDLGKFFLRHYSTDEGRLNSFSLALYLINLRNLIENQDWSSSKWRYNKEEFLKIFDQKSLFLLRIPHITHEDLSLIKMLLFWKIASQSNRISSIYLSDSINILTLGGLSEGHGLMSAIPWKETFECNWEELEKQFANLKPYLNAMELSVNVQELKGIISKSIANPAFKAVIKNACIHEELYIQKMFQVACQPRFDYGQFFCIVLDNINHNPEERTKNLREAICFIYGYNPAVRFSNLFNSLMDSVPNLFKAIAIDLKDSENGQKELFSCLLKPRCESFRDEALFLIFPELRTLHNDKFICKLFKEVKQKKITHSMLWQLLLVVLQQPVQRSTWDKLSKYELPHLLESVQDVPKELLEAIFHLYNDRKKIHPDVIFKVFFNIWRLEYDKEQIKSSFASCIALHRQVVFHHFNDLIRIGVFTPQMLWEILSTSPFDIKEVQFLNNLSAWCQEKDPAMKPLLEEYWKEVGNSHKLPQSILKKFEKVLPAIECIKTPEIVEKTPTISESGFQKMLRSLIEKYEHAYQHPFSELSLEDFWLYLTSENFFDWDSGLSKEDLEVFSDQVYPKFKKAPIRDIILVLRKLYDLTSLYVSDQFPKLFQRLVDEDALLENSISYILDENVCVYEDWPCVEILIYSSQMYISSEDKTKIKEQIIGTVIKKARLNPNVNENVIILKGIHSLCAKVSPETFVLFFKNFSEIMHANPYLYRLTEENVDGFLLWEDLLSSFYVLMKQEWSDSPNRLEWFKKMEFHYVEFNMILKPGLSLHYAELAESFELGWGTAVMISQLNKRIEAFRKISIGDNGIIEMAVREKYLSEWQDIWIKLEYYPWSLEHCWSLYEIFSSSLKIPLSENKQISLFLTLDNKISGFFCMQKLIFDSITILIMKGDFIQNSNKNFTSMQRLHTNFLNFYKWMQGQYKKAPKDKVLKKMNSVMKIHLCMHMSALTTIRRISTSFYEEYGNMNFELFDFIVKHQVAFKYDHAHALICETGFLSFDKTKRKEFLDLVSAFSFSGGAFTPIPKFNLTQRENVVIIFVLKGLQELMGSGKLTKAREYFIEMMDLHPALSSPVAIDTIVNYMNQCFELIETPETDAQILRMICYAYFVIDICNYAMSPSLSRRRYDIKLAAPILELTGMIKFLDFLKSSKHSFVIENEVGLTKRLQQVSDKYEKWQNQ